MDVNDNTNESGRATLRAFAIGLLLSGVFAWYTVMRDNMEPIRYLSAHVIGILPFMMLFVTALLINPLLQRLPLLHRTRLFRPFNVSELLLVFVMCAVGAGTASYGLAGRLVPLVTSVSNAKLNTPQSKMDVNVLPFLNEDFFILETGTHDAAVRVREAHLAYVAAQKQYRTAKDLLLGQSERVRIEAEKAEVPADLTPEMRKLQLRKLDYSLARTNRLIELATESWEVIGKGLDPAVVAETYGETLNALRQKREDLRQALQEKNQVSFDAVERIRNGLPKGARAIPGFIYIPGEGLIAYAARYQRMRVGGGALEKLNALLAEVDPAQQGRASRPADLGPRFEAIASDLEPITTAAGLDAYRTALDKDLQSLTSDLAARKADIQALRSKLRFSKFEDAAGLDTQLKDMVEPIESLEEAIKALKEKISRHITPVEEACAAVQAAREVLLSLAKEAGTVPPAELHTRLLNLRASFHKFDATARRFWVGDGDWEIWFTPIANWLLLIFLGYLVFLTFNTLVYRQWSHNEKLLYPLAEITTLLAEGHNKDAGKAPPIYKTGLFWFGFVIAAGILGWNHLAGLQIISNLGKISLHTEYSTYTGQTFKAIEGGYFLIVFAVIGISFLLPSNISFSFWGFEVLAMTLYVVMRWLGYGGSFWSAGSLLPRTELGCGGMLVFGAVIFWTCRHYLFCAIRSEGVKDLQADERRELRVSSFLFLAGALALTILLILRFDVNPIYAVLYLVLVLFITIVTVRMVAEGGIIGLHSGLSAYDFWIKMAGTTKAWCAPVLFAPLMVYDGLLMGTLKGFVAPAMANALKVREKIRIRRLAFHGAISAGILVSVLVSIVTLVILCYDVGANSLNPKMHEAMITAPAIGRIIDNPPASNPKSTKWILTGVGLMVILLVARRSVFWIPHPIGLVALMNPRMMNLWGSILIGWIFKSLVSKYCDEQQYLRLRCLFIGLVIGHIFACGLGWDQLEWLRPYGVH